jgi:hypothetical protein
MERFWEKVDRTGDCWLWLASRNEGGYGLFWDGTAGVLAHRFAYGQLVGPVSDGLDHRPTCPKNCVNPAHLRPVTQKQNMENLTGAYSTSKSGVRGVAWSKAAGRWRAQVQHRGKQYYLGLFDTVELAGAAAEAKRLELFTHNDLDRMAADQ